MDETVGRPPSRAAPAGRPKQRRLRACNSCRQRKLRCDDIPGSCRNCQAYGETCVISRDGKTLRRAVRGASIACPGTGPPRRTRVAPLSRSPTSSPSTHSGSAARRDQSTHSGADNGMGDGRGSQIDAADDHDKVTDNTCRAPPMSQYSPASPASPLPSQDADGSLGSIGCSPRHTTSVSPDASLPGADSLSCQGVVTTEVGVHPNNAKFAGVSSAQVLGKVAEEVSRPYAPTMNVMDFFCPAMSYAEEFPLAVPSLRPLVDKAVADQCVACYFRTYHNLFPILEQHTFRLLYETFYAGTAQHPTRVACIYLVIALGADRIELFQTHLRAAYNLYSCLVAQPFLASVQALILLTICFFNADKDGQGILCIALATQISMSMGLHRSLYIHHHPREFAFVLRDHNTRNCIWWTCYCLEKMLAFEHGRCSSIHDDDCDAELPVLSASSTPSLTCADDGAPFVFLISFTRLAKALSGIARNLFNRTASNLGVDELLQRVATADDDLLGWCRSLPTHLQPDRDYVRHDSVAQTGSQMLHCIYYNALVIIHRASLVFMAKQPVLLQGHPNRRIAASDSVCLNAARSLIRAANHLVLEQSTFPFLRWMNPYAINAVMALYIGVLQWPLRWSCQTDLALMRSLCRSFERSSDGGAAGRFRYLLTSLTDAATKAEAVARPLSSESDAMPPSCGMVDWPRPEAVMEAAAAALEPGGQDPTQDRPHHHQETHGNHGNEPWMMTPAPSDLFSVPPVFVLSDVDMLPSNDTLQFGDFFGDQTTTWNMWPVGADPTKEDGLLQDGTL